MGCSCGPDARICTAVPTTLNCQGEKRQRWKEKSRRASRNLRTGVDPTGGEPGQPRGKGAWAGKAGQQLSIPEMRKSVQERSGGVDIGG